MIEKYELSIFGAKIADMNYYNDIHKIIRVDYKSRLYDFKYLSFPEIPNPNRHMAVIITFSENLKETMAIPDERMSFLPGIKDQFGNLVDKLPLGFVYILSKKQEISRTNPTSGGAGFALTRINMFEQDKVAIALAPPLDKDYTNTETESNLDDAVGIFMNTDGAILIKSRGSSITFGDEGMYIGGNVAWQHSEHQKEWMMDNSFRNFIPSTIVSFPISIPTLPNIAKFAQIAEGARKVRDIIGKTENVAKIIT